jgi:Lrp/AsnC family transcriptional regulator
MVCNDSLAPGVALSFQFRTRIEFICFNERLTIDDRFWAEVSRMTLDDMDRHLLAELQQDASLSHAELAKRTGMSTASCWRRIKSLEAAGVLMRPVRLVDPAAVDCETNVFLHIRIASHARGDRATFEDFVQTRPEIAECYSMSGEWDYLLRIVTYNVAGYERFLMLVLLDHPSVAASSSHFALSQTKYTTALPILQLDTDMARPLRATNHATGRRA